MMKQFNHTKIKIGLSALLAVLLALSLCACGERDYGYMGGYFVGMSPKEFGEVESHWYTDNERTLGYFPKDPNATTNGVYSESTFERADGTIVSPYFVYSYDDDAICNISFENRCTVPMSLEECKAEEEKILSALLVERELTDVQVTVITEIEELRKLTAEKEGLLAITMPAYSSGYDKNSPDYAQFEGEWDASSTTSVEDIDYCVSRCWDDGKSVTLFTIMHCTRNGEADCVFYYLSQAQKAADGTIMR